MSESISTNAKLDTTRVAKLMQGAGVCLAIYQRIETYLKLLLPHVVPAGTRAVEQPALCWRSLLDSKLTLGSLVQQFSEKMNSENPDGFGRYLEELVAQRNDFVHHFFTKPIGQVSSDADLERAIDHVRDLMNFSVPFERALHEITGQFAAAIERSILDDESLAQELKSIGRQKNAP